MDESKLQKYTNQVFVDLGALERSLPETERQQLSLTEKLALLRNIETMLRSDESRSRTLISFIGLAFGFIALAVLLVRSFAVASYPTTSHTGPCLRQSMGKERLIRNRLSDFPIARPCWLRLP